jgi:hypothetical protein
MMDGAAGVSSIFRRSPVPVTFTDDANGTLAATTVTTDASGVASDTITLGREVGTDDVTVTIQTASGSVSVTMHETAADGARHAPVQDEPHERDAPRASHWRRSHMNAHFRPRTPARRSPPGPCTTRSTRA